MTKKKILLFIDWYIPGYKAGGPIQSVANLVEQLKDVVDFSIVTRNTDYCETEPYKGIKSNEWTTTENGTRIYYFSADQLNRANIRNLIRKEHFDCVYLNGIYSTYFTLYPLLFLRKKHEKKIIIAAKGMLSNGSLGVKSVKKRFFLRTVKVLRLFDNVVFHATNSSEKQDIEKNLGQHFQIHVAGNLAQKTPALTWKEKEKKEGSVKLVNIARVSPEKNLLYALQLLRNVKTKVVVDIYGPIYNQEYWNKCQQEIKNMPSNIIVNYKGSLESEKVLHELTNYHFLFMPSTGENFGHIILQSLSAGCPVIISDQTPWKELQQKNIGWDIALQDQHVFIETIENCSQMGQTAYNQLSKSAVEFAKRHSENRETLEQNKLLFL